MRSFMRSLPLLFLIVFTVPAFAARQARPGMVNYVEGNVRLGPSPITPNQVGTACLNPGSILSTRKGKAEVLLTPGVYLRVGSHSTVRMISPDLTLTKVELLRGRAAVEVDRIMPENDIQVLNNGVSTRLINSGYYEFQDNPALLRVFSGKAQVPDGPHGEILTVKGHHMVRLESGVAARSISFNTRDAQDDLTRWSQLRSQYLADADQRFARRYAGAYGYDPGWYWNPYGYGYAYLAPSPFWGPVGLGYSPWWGGGYWGGGFWGGGGYWGGGDFDDDDGGR